MTVQGGSRYSLAVGAISGVLLLHACSGDEREFDEEQVTAGQGGDGGSAGSNTPGGGAAGSGTGGSGASGGSVSGSSSAGESGGEGGAGGAAEPAPCGGLVCLHGGTCEGEGESARCDCAGTGYEGVSCDENVDECENTPCSNGTACADRIGSYSCDCTAAPNYTGTNCDLLRFEALPETFIPRDISPDGSVVVGADKNTIAYKYVEGEAVYLGFLIGDNASIAYGASANGAVVVGASGTNFTYDTSTAVRWDGPDLTPLKAPESYTKCAATGVSADGRVIGGTCYQEAMVVVRWVDGTFEPLGIAEGVEACRDVVVSDDGSTLAGTCSIYPSNRGFLWTKDAGFKLLPAIASASNCVLYDLSTDGAAAVGECVSGNAGPGSGYVWTAASGSKALLKAEGVINARGVAISGNGLRVLGADAGASLWENPQAASTPLRDLLPSGTPGLAEWHLADPIAMSADGKTIVGQGTLDSSKRHYIARVD